ncbi:glycoside hydrolase family 3 N-terminal domain-containing protein [Pinibacter aurantiacus]|uniref:Glycoside hydrolase family 3 C-terminal domain-containing protein n=1 Tax=Pinibacter aurantiacus TaxID=2851599 RepID=A0A9E2W477_9BACT|nr:glycoside hydrolase family 3 N-terminal domain-containing protein [Pinibacter aurantiacus]MBV4357574.1 glycoside hydrolase family 3 C-terminal domain-containing protein [Pinibacter aurantiacus]
MNRILIALTLSVTCLANGVLAQSAKQNGWIDFNKNGRKDVYEDPTQAIDKRVSNLLSQMTMEEKTCQLATLYGYGAVLKDRLPQPGWRDSVWKDGIANIDEQLTGLRKDTMYAYPYSSHAGAINSIQKWFVEQTRLGIPVDFTTEGIRGLNHMKATYFPAQIAQACTFNKELVHRIAQVTGREAKALGYTNVYSPILDVASDPRWGRIEETYGCDPFLVAELGRQNITGIQENKIVSTVKHFAVYGIPVGGRDGGTRTDPHVAPREMWELYLEPFRVAFEEAGAMGTMASYNDYDGVPIIGNYYFLTDILRKQFKFKGYVVSDSHAFEDLWDKYHVAVDTADAAKQALSAGMNVRTDFAAPRPYIMGIRRGIKNGSIPMSVIDQRVSEVLRVKFWLGLFDNPYVKDTTLADGLVHNQEAKDLAALAAKQSVVLLKNENNTLPLNKNSIKTIALIGPNVKEEKSLLSRYGPVHTNVVTFYDGITKALPSGTKVLYAKGCTHTDKNFPESDIEDFPLTADEDAALKEAVDAASAADVVLLAVGDNENTIGETHSRLSLKLPGRQEELVKRIAALGKPTVLVLIGGRPVTINYASKNLPAIIETWYLGETMGDAIASVLFGEYNPGGKLCVPFPKHVGQIPLSFPMKPAADGFGDANVRGFLYPFGFGLSYTTFAYSDLKVNADQYASKGEVTVTFKIKNTGKYAGDEIAQLYLHDQLSSVATYVRKLRGFERVSLQPGEEKQVTMTLHSKDFSLINREMKRVVEPGWFDVLIGASSEDVRLSGKIKL